MLFRITDIVFDFETSEGEVSETTKQEALSSVLGKVWEADNLDDLLEKITDETGWCISHIQAQ